MKHISSSQNALYKQLARLVQGRRVDARIVLEGVHVCQAWLQRQGPPELAVFDAQRMRGDQELADLLARLPDRSCISCEPDLMQRLSQVPSGQGVYFVVTAPTPAVPARIDCNALWLDRIQDPGNVGTLLRTAAAAGLRQAYLSAGCASAWSPKVVRSGQGAHFVMAIYEHRDLLDECEKLRIPLIATDLHNAQPLTATSLPRDCVWLMGNEGQGIDARLLARADIRVYIPQSAQVESLNVAAAAAICLFEQRRQHGR